MAAVLASVAGYSTPRSDKEQLARVNQWFEVALNNMARGLSMFDAEQRLIVCNKLYREIYDLPYELTRPGTPLSDIVRYHVMRETGRGSPEDIELQRKWIAEHVAELARGKTFTHTQHLTGGRTILVTNQPLSDGSWVDLQEDITERRQAEEKISWLARHDALTEIPNRFHFHEQLETALQSLRPGDGLAVHWIDLDHFKDVNDDFGHPVGDALLRASGHACMRRCAGRISLGASGATNSPLYNQASPVKTSDRVCRIACCERFSESHQLMGHPIAIAASIGIALAPEQGRSADELLKNADIALYHAKSMGRGRYVLFDPDYSYEKQSRRRLEADLSVALKERQLELYYQPIRDVKTKEVKCCEALMRWHHPQLGLVPPSDFIPLAEETGLIVAMGEWALHQACKDAMTWPEEVGVTVNLSASQFCGSDLYKTVEAALNLSGLVPQRLELEITESGTLARRLQYSHHPPPASPKGCPHRAR